MIKTDPSTARNNLVDFIPYEKLAKAIILQSMKDYANKKEKHWLSVRSWVRNKQGTFNLCAAIWDKNSEKLQKLMIEKMDAIDQGEPLKLADKVK